ncbi:MAG: sodium:proton symporter [Firmicutes bacterium HGW-Firmicutes-14]|nr:MAG: sodium:proton symporter [Firmicutes bacterium HGW-Firmicutes-14]
MKKILHYPAKNLVLVIPIALITGFITGYFTDTGFLKGAILPLTFLMIYPTMIGFKISEAYNLTHIRVLLFSLLLNFAAIPLLAYLIGLALLQGQPEMLAGLVLASLLPTSGMTISWTMIFKGNVPAAIKMTAVGLITGSLLAPWYLWVMVGKMVPINVGQLFITISVIVFLPMIFGHLTFRLLRKRLTQEEFQKRIKPYLPSFSIWAMLLIIFSSISMKAKMIILEPELIVNGIVVLVVFYTVNFALSTAVGRTFFDRGDGIALVYGTVMRNLSISLGVALAAFGVKAALIVTLAFIIQVQSAAWYGKLAEKHGLFRDRILNITREEA